MRLKHQQGQTQPVYYISLIASDWWGRHVDEYFAFDEGSKIDLEGTGVDFLDVHSLVDEYRLAHQTEKTETITVYDLLEDFIDRNKKASFFVDECPFVASKDFSRPTLIKTYSMHASTFFVSL